MAKIDLYEARGLAKQSVGTPGMDKSGSYIEDAGGDILSATATFIKAENAKREIADNILAETERIKWENSLYNELETAKQQQENLDNPYGLADSVFNTAQASAQSYAKSISNPRARQKFLDKSVSTVRQAQGSMRNWASGQTVTNAFVSVKEGIDAITVQAGKMNDPAGFNGALSQAEALIANATPVIGAKNAYQLRDKMRKDIANSFIYSKIDGSPQSVASYLDSGMFDGVLSEPEKHNIRVTADALVRRNTKQQQNAANVGHAANYQGLVSRAGQGKLTVSEVNNEIERLKAAGVAPGSRQMKNVERLKQRLIDGNGFVYATRNDAGALERVNEAFGLIRKEGKGKEAQYYLENASLNQLRDIQDTLDENSHLLTKKTRDNMQAVLNNAWENHVKDNPYAKKPTWDTDVSSIMDAWNLLKNKGKPLDEYNEGLLAGYRYIDRNYSGKYNARAKVFFSKMFNDYYNEERRQPEYSLEKVMVKQYNKIDERMARMIKGDQNELQ